MTMAPAPACLGIRIVNQVIQTYIELATKFCEIFLFKARMKRKDRSQFTQEFNRHYTTHSNTVNPPEIISDRQFAEQRSSKLTV